MIKSTHKGVEKKYEITSYFENSRCIGFICRRSIVFGSAQGIPDGWITCQGLLSHKWMGNFPTRKEAVAFLRGAK